MIMKSMQTGQRLAAISFYKCFQTHHALSMIYRKSCRVGEELCGQRVNVSFVGTSILRAISKCLEQLFVIHSVDVVVVIVGRVASLLVTALMHAHGTEHLFDHGIIHIHPSTGS
jgi:hypothetical protein